MDHVQVGVGEGVLGHRWWAGLNAGILRVVVGFVGLGGGLLPLGQVQVCICDVIVVLDLSEMERRSFWSPQPLTHPQYQVWLLLSLLGLHWLSPSSCPLFSGQGHLSPVLPFQSASSSHGLKGLPNRQCSGLTSLLQRHPLLQFSPAFPDALSSAYSVQPSFL